MECKKEQNKDYCNCTYPCSKHGICCDCISYHRKAGELPACYFPKDAEKSYDRSISNFLDLIQERGYWWN
jgi:hypothetical protein